MRMKSSNWPRKHKRQPSTPPGGIVPRATLPQPQEFPAVTLKQYAAILAELETRTPSDVAHARALATSAATYAADIRKDIWEADELADRFTMISDRFNAWQKAASTKRYNAIFVLPGPSRGPGNDEHRVVCGIRHAPTLGAVHLIPDGSDQYGRAVAVEFDGPRATLRAGTFVEAVA